MNEDVLDELREVALRAMREGYYGDYIVAVVRGVLFRNHAIMNPEEEIERERRKSREK